MRKVVPWIVSHPKLSILLFFLGLLLLLNFLAYRHAHAMTHFVAGGKRPGNVASLSFLDKMRMVFGGLTVDRPHRDETPGSVGLSYEVHTFAGSIGDLEGWYVPHPDPAGTVVLFHGYVSCKAALVPEVRAFHDLGYACFLVDFPGSGGSAGDEVTIGYREAEDVARTVAHVRAHWPGQPLVLYGQSMGSAAVLRALAVAGVEADAVVLECPFDRLLTTVEARFSLVSVPSFPSAQLLVFWGGVQHGFNGFRHNPVDYARDVKCPVFLLHGRCDPHVSGEQIASIYANLAGPKQLHVFEGLGHEPYVPKKAGEWKECVGKFLTRRMPVEMARKHSH
jgi:alpha-beta hydrolase superfamily lysophospholipase